MLRSTLLTLVIFFTACGPSAEDIQRIKAQAIQEKEATERAEESAKKALQGAQSNLYSLTEQLVNSRAALTVAEDRLRRAHDFKIGRLRADREREIYEATTRVEEMRMQVLHYEAEERKAKERVDELASQIPL